MAVLIAILAAQAASGPVVIENSTDRVISFTVASQAEQHAYTLPPQRLVALAVEQSTVLKYAAGHYRLAANSAHRFTVGAGGVGLQCLYPRLAEQNSGLPAHAPANSQVAAEADSRLVRRRPTSITVKVLVDDDERAARQRWEDRLRKRVLAASKILEEHCGLGLEIGSIGTWNSDKQRTEYQALYDELKSNVPLETARLVIGFSRQLKIDPPTAHPASQPLATHLLIGDGSVDLSEPERLEILLHQLGHFLGAADSADSASVMRSRLGDRRALAQSFQIRFDPLNTLVLNLVAQGFETADPRSLVELVIDRRQNLAGLYSAMATAAPDNTQTKKLLDELAISSIHPAEAGKTAAAPPVATDPQPQSSPVNITSHGQLLIAPTRDAVRPETAGMDADSVQTIVRALMEAAQENAARPPGRRAGNDELFRRTGDALAEHYVRVAAVAARALSQATRARSMLVGLATAMNGLDNTVAFQQSPGQANETPSQRDARLAVMSAVAATYQNDVACAQAFFHTAAMSAVAESNVALEETATRITQSSDLTADQALRLLCAAAAGASFADHVMDPQTGLGALSRRFELRTYQLDSHSVWQEAEWSSVIPAISSLEGQRTLATLRRHASGIKRDW